MDGEFLFVGVPLAARCVDGGSIPLDYVGLIPHNLGYGRQGLILIDTIAVYGDKKFICI